MSVACDTSRKAEPPCHWQKRELSALDISSDLRSLPGTWDFLVIQSVLLLLDLLGVIPGADRMVAVAGLLGHDDAPETDPNK